jgi:hypothetical protein
MDTRIFCSLSLLVCENYFVLDYEWCPYICFWRKCHGDSSGFICQGLQLTKYKQFSCYHRLDLYTKYGCMHAWNGHCLLQILYNLWVWISCIN